MIKDPICYMEVPASDITLEYKGKRYRFCSQGCREKFERAMQEYAEKYLYDLIIVGGGPAGLTAGVYASVQRIDTFLITQNIGGQAVDSTKIKNYLGFDFITGPELVGKFQDQLIHEHYIDHRIGTAFRVDRFEDGYEVLTTEREKYRAKTVIVSTGMSRNRLNVPGEERLQRRGVAYRSVQDISLFAGLDIAVVGGGNSGVQTVMELSKVGRTIYLISDETWTADASVVEEARGLENLVSFEGYTVMEITGKDRVKGLTIRSRRTGERETLSVAGVFVQIGLRPNSDLVADLVERNERDEIVIGPDCATSAPGIFAAGDVTNAYGKRIIIASGEGAKAVLAAKRYLLSQRKGA